MSVADQEIRVPPVLLVHVVQQDPLELLAVLVNKDFPDLRD